MEAQSSIALARQEPRLVTGLLAATLLGWGFLAWAVVDMTHPLAQLMMPMNPAWSVSNVLAVFVMWSVMMMAMMLPTALPMALTFATLCRRQGRIHQAWIFIAAYLAIWTLFSAGATLLQWGLQTSGLITPMMVSRSVGLTGALLVVAGVVQFTPLKQVCLRHCRTPMGFLLTEWREGGWGAWWMGIRHGLVCLGCCWALMGLLFVTGVMNLAWVAAITAALVIEKLHPAGVSLGKLLGGGLIAAGIARIALLSFN
jgi:predicted metal-binding membrane protein